jgi:hypothetical protein
LRRINAHRDKREETAPASKLRSKYTRLFRLAEETTKPIYLFRFPRPLIDAVLCRGIRLRQIR